MNLLIETVTGQAFVPARTEEQIIAVKAGAATVDHWQSVDYFTPQITQHGDVVLARWQTNYGRGATDRQVIVARADIPKLILALTKALIKHI